MNRTMPTMPPKKEVTGIKDYSTLIAEKLRQMRMERGWSVEEFAKKINEHSTLYICNQCNTKAVASYNAEFPKHCFNQKCDGTFEAFESDVQAVTIYKWELGRLGGGRNISPEWFPVIAEIYGLASATAWLPESV